MEVKISDENCRLLSGKLDSFQRDVDSRLDGMNKWLDIMEAKMLPVKWMVVSILVLLSVVALAFVEVCAVVIFNQQ